MTVMDPEPYTQRLCLWTLVPICAAGLALLIRQPLLYAQTKVHEQNAEGMVEACAIDTEGKQYAVALVGAGAPLQVFATKTGKLVRAFPRDLGQTRAMLFSSNGRLLIHSVWTEADDDIRIRGYQVSTGKKVFDLKGYRELIKALALSPDEKRLAAAYSDSSVRLWDLASGKVAALLDEDIDPVALSFSLNSRYLAAAGDGEMVVWDLAAEKKVASFRNKPATPLLNLIFINEGKGIQAIDMAGRLFCYDVEKNSSRLLFQLGEQFPPRTATAFSPDGSLLATGTNEVVVFWDTKTGKELSQFKHPRFYEVRCLRFS